jgi:NADH:ubiquinone oxidoreductase subunit
MDACGAGVYIGGMDIGTWLHTVLRGRLVGTDGLGNRYYIERRPRRGAKPRRWMLFAGEKEASVVPPEWHAWLHHTTESPLPDQRRPWMKPHQPNLTGTPGSYRPPGHDYRGGHRARATGDYEAWTPD